MEALTRLSPAEFHAVYRRDRIELDRGTLSADEYWRRVFAAGGVGATPGLLVRIEREDALGWSRVNQRVVDWSYELREAGLGTAILSNMPCQKLAFMREDGQFRWIDDFSVAVFSCEHLLVKPEPSIYRLCVEKLGASPGESPFLDVVPENAEGARAVGMRGVEFRGLEGLATALALTATLESGRRLLALVDRPPAVRDPAVPATVPATGPLELDGVSVPPVLVSGHHEQVRRWRLRESLRRTLERRPDLLEGRVLTREEAGLLAEISKLGTNLLTATNGQSYTGTAELPKTAPGMVAELPGVTALQYTGALSNVNAYRSPHIPAIDTNALSVDASSTGLPAAVSTSLAQGTYLNAATENEPVAVLGYQAAHRLGIDRIWQGEKIWVGGMWFFVVGVLNPATLAPQIDSSVLIGFPAAEKYLGFDGHPSEIYVRAQNNQVAAVDSLLAAQANPESPNQVAVSRPSAALTAQADAAGAFNTLFLGLGAVALLVGAVGVANIMIISVLERRPEIGLRRALGATKGQIRIQFLSEAILLSLIGGAIGVGVGAAAVAIYTYIKAEATVIPAEAWAGGIGAAIAIGAISGLMPALRAARMSPTQALWSI